MRGKGSPDRCMGARLVPMCNEPGFAWDVEVIALARVMEFTYARSALSGVTRMAHG